MVPVSAVILDPDGLHVATVDATNHATHRSGNARDGTRDRPWRFWRAAAGADGDHESAGLADGWEKWCASRAGNGTARASLPENKMKLTTAIRPHWLGALWLCWPDAKWARTTSSGDAGASCLLGQWTNAEWHSAPPTDAMDRGAWWKAVSGS